MKEDKKFIEKLQFIDAMSIKRDDSYNITSFSVNFYGAVDLWKTEDFVWEWEYMVTHYADSLTDIKVHINSEGGSVLRGMDVFSSIYNTPEHITVTGIVEGLAGSMGSVILAACDVRMGRKWSIIMVHSPFSANGDLDSDDQIIKAFVEQLKSIYVEQFGLSEEKVIELMEGKDGEDGTWLSAKDAVKLGIIEEILPAKNSKVVADACAEHGICATATSDIFNPKKFLNIVAEILNDENKPLLKNNSTHLQKTNSIAIEANADNKNLTKMIDKQINEALGLEATAVETDVLASINVMKADRTSVDESLIEATAKVDGLQAKVDAAEIQATADKTTISNQAEKLTSVKAELQVFQDAEKLAKENEIKAMVDKAVEDKKIKAEAKDQWVVMATSNFDATKEALEGIQGAIVISDHIKGEKDADKKIEKTEDEIKAEAHEAKVAGAVGNFEFKKI